MPRQKVLQSLKPQKFFPPKGRKEVWLPTWHITLVRTPHLPSNMAEFLVPMNINKLDLKDYLFHAYGIPALSIRSSIQQLGVKRKWQGGPQYRPKSTKRMIVEMDTSYRGGPFAWPAEVEDFAAWDKQLFEDTMESRKAMQENQGRYGSGPIRREAGVLEAQVQELVERKQVWKPSWSARNDTSSQQMGAGTPMESTTPTQT